MVNSRPSSPEPSSRILAVAVSGFLRENRVDLEAGPYKVQSRPSTSALGLRLHRPGRFGGAHSTDLIEIVQSRGRLRIFRKDGVAILGRQVELLAPQIEEGAVEPGLLLL